MCVSAFDFSRSCAMPMPMIAVLVSVCLPVLYVMPCCTVTRSDYVPTGLANVSLGPIRDPRACGFIPSRFSLQ